MKAIFGVLSLLIVLAIVASIAKTQLQGTGSASSLTTRSNEAAREAARQAGDGSNRDSVILVAPGGGSADAGNATAPVQARNIENQVRDNAVRAMQQGTERNQRAEP